MVSQDVPRNTSQRAGKIIRASDRITDSNIGIYTVPPGKTARITDLQGNVDAVGVDATYAIAVKKGVVFTAITLFKGAALPITASAVTLDAGDILTDIGDAGATNATFDLSATIEEFSA